MINLQRDAKELIINELSKSIPSVWDCHLIDLGVATPSARNTEWTASLVAHPLHNLNKVSALIILVTIPFLLFAISNIDFFDRATEQRARGYEWKYVGDKPLDPKSKAIPLQCMQNDRPCSKPYILWKLVPRDWTAKQHCGWNVPHSCHDCFI